jgi:hypothetical protein
MILTHILAIIIVAILGNTGLLFFLPIRKKLAKSKFLLVVVSTSMTFFSNIFAVYVLLWLCGKLNVKPLLTMLIIPYLIILLKGFKRIRRAKSGRRMAEISLEETGEIYHGSEKFQSFLVRHEYGYFLGDLLGLSVGAVLFL